VASLELRIRAIAAELLDRFPTGRPADLVEEFALPLLATVISELLGCRRPTAPHSAPGRRDAKVDFEWRPRRSE